MKNHTTNLGHIIDKQIFSIIEKEMDRLQNSIELIASENVVSNDVMLAQGSILTNKYAEGYPRKRYYGGCEFVDEVEELAISRVTELYNCKYVNVQPHSGSQANQAVFMALLNPGDKILGLSLSSGGHLTHGSKVNMSGKWFNALSYNVRRDDGLIDFDMVRDMALKERPKLIITGYSAYPRIIDFAKFREIADESGAMLMIDMSHFSGQVAAKLYPNPLDYADVVTSTTHKTLRGPRGGMILMNNEDIYKKINSAIFPGIQGGPLMHVIAAKAIAYGEALQPEFKAYMQDVLDNSKQLASTLIKNGYKIFTDGTDTHLLLADLRGQGLKGNLSEQSLERAHLTCNKNSIPFDDEKPTITSGIRLGSPAATSRGMKRAEFEIIGNLIAKTLDGLKNNPNDNSKIEEQVRNEVIDLCKKFPLYNKL